MWDHKKVNYNDRNFRDVFLSTLQTTLSQKTKESITKKFSSLRNSYIRERKRDNGSITTGSGSDDVYTSKWKFFVEMDFLQEEIEGDASTDTFGVSQDDMLKVTQMKRKSKEQEQDDIKVNLWKSALDMFQSTQDPVNVEPADPDERWLLSLCG